MRLNTAIVLGVCVGLLTVGVPAGAVGEPTVREQNRGWLFDRMDTWHPEEPATIYGEDGSQRMPSREAMDWLLDRLDRVNLDLDDAFDGFARPQGHPDQPANHSAGDIYVFESNTGGPSCKQNGGGAGGHYNKIILQTGENGVQRQPIWFTTHEYIGYATSNITTGENGHGIVGPIITLGDTTVPPYDIFANEVIYYQGNSDFKCLKMGGLTVNFPFLRGSVGPLPHAAE